MPGMPGFGDTGCGDKRKIEGLAKKMQNKQKIQMDMYNEIDAIQKRIESMEKQRRMKEQAAEAKREKNEQERLYNEAKDQEKQMAKAAAEVEDRIKYLNGSLARAKDDAARNKIKEELKEVEQGKKMLADAKDEVTAQLAEVADRRQRAIEKAEKQAAIEAAEAEMKAIMEMGQTMYKQAQELQQSLDADKDATDDDKQKRQKEIDEIYNKLNGGDLEEEFFKRQEYFNQLRNAFEIDNMIEEWERNVADTEREFREVDMYIEESQMWKESIEARIAEMENNNKTETDEYFQLQDELMMAGDQIANNEMWKEDIIARREGLEQQKDDFLEQQR